VNEPTPLMNPASPRTRRPLARAGAVCLVWTAGIAAVQADLFTPSVTVGSVVPDGNASGLVSVIDLAITAGPIRDVNVSLNLEGARDGGWNGDLYVLLAHGSHSVVLLNRPGRASANPFGYGDNGFDITLDDDATGDAHLYGALLSPSDSISPVSGTWQPDGRFVDPAVVLDTSPRTRLLSGFNGLDPAGEWRLFVADLSLGGVVKLASWSLQIETDAVVVPESARTGAVAGLALLVGGALMLRRRLG